MHLQRACDLPSTWTMALYRISKLACTRDPSEKNDINDTLPLHVMSPGRSFPQNFRSSGAVVSFPSNIVMQSVLSSRRKLVKCSHICCKTNSDVK